MLSYCRDYDIIELDFCPVEFARSKFYFEC